MIYDDARDYLEEEVNEIYQKCLKHNVKINDLTHEEKEAYEKATYCHICEEEIKGKRILCKGRATHSTCGESDGYVNKSKREWQEYFDEKECSVCGGCIDDKVRDHCHLTGKYRGAAHRSCNLN